MKIIAWLVGIILIIALLVVGYTALALNWSYSEGERAGYLQKLSKKGWVCKTYEGELAMVAVPGSTPIIWKFTVHDEALAKQLDTQLGKQISLHYEEHIGVPTNCYGDTNYYVTRLNVINK